MFSDMKRQLKQREDGGWARVQWDIVRVSRWLIYAWCMAHQGEAAGRHCADEVAMADV